MTTPEIAEKLSIAGTPEECVAKIKEIESAGVNHMILCITDPYILKLFAQRDVDVPDVKGQLELIAERGHAALRVTTGAVASTIYQATSEEHFRLVAALYEEYFRWVAEQFRAAFSVDIEQDVEGAHERFMATREALMPPRGRLYLVDRDRGPAATGALKPLADEIGYLKRMFVLPVYRRQGLSRLVLERLLGDARDIGYRQVLLETAPFMTAAQQLYRSVGFREREPFSGSEIPPEFHDMAIFMELDL